MLILLIRCHSLSLCYRTNYSNVKFNYKKSPKPKVQLPSSTMILMPEEQNYFKKTPNITTFFLFFINIINNIKIRDASCVLHT